MKRIKLLGLLSLFVVPVLGSAAFSTSYRNENNIAANEIRNYSKDKINDPEPEPEHFFRVGEGYYDDLQSAINAVSGDNATIQVLKDFEAPHERETDKELDAVAINKSLTIDGIGDDGIMHQIIGQKIDVNNATVNFENVIINGDKKFNKNGANGDHYLIGCSESTINLNKHTVIKSYKFDGFCMIKLKSGSILNINDQTEITDCAAKFGLVRYDSDTNCPSVYMRGGRIHDNYSSNKGFEADGYVEGLVFYILGNKNGPSNPAKFYMYGGEIYNNTAKCWDDSTQCHSVGLMFLHNHYVDIKILGGSIHNNVTKLGGAICYGYHIKNTGFDYRPKGSVEIGGSTYIYGNHGCNDDGTQFDSNIYIDRPDLTDSKKNIIISEEYPLTKVSKTGILFSDEDLPDAGVEKMAVQNASYNDLPHFVADNEDYTMRYQGDTTNTLAIYKYTEKEPHLTDPVFNDDLHYNGQEQKLIYTPGVVTKGGTLVYSQDYVDDISKAHWTSNPDEIVGKESGDYPVAYYVKAGGGCEASVPVTRTVHIGKTLMDIVWHEDNFVYNGKDQKEKLIPHYLKDGGEKKLEIEPLKLEGGATTVENFLDVTIDPNARYVVTAIDPHDESLDFPKDHTRYYTMRISEKQYIDEGKIEIEVDEKTNKPTVEVESDIGYDAWTTLNGKKLDKKKHEKEYKAAVNELSKTKKMNNNVILSGVYDVTMLSHTYEGGEEVVTVVRELDGNLKISLLLPKGVKGSSFKVYQVHENEDGSKEVISLKHTFEKDGYVTVITNKLSAFAIIKSKKSLLWLIILLSIVNALLIGALVYIFFKIKKSKDNRNDLGASV